VISINRHMKNVALTLDPVTQAGSFAAIDLADAQGDDYFLVMRERFLGAPEDVERTVAKYRRWKAYRDESRRLLAEGNAAAFRTRVNGDVGSTCTTASVITSATRRLISSS